MQMIGDTLSPLKFIFSLLNFLKPYKSVGNENNWSQGCFKKHINYVLNMPNNLNQPLGLHLGE